MGPRTLLVGQEGTFRALAMPITVSRPLTLTWDNGSIGSTAVYSWTTPGSYAITVTATNPCGEVHQGVLPVQVLEEWPYSIFLPLVLR